MWISGACWEVTDMVLVPIWAVWVAIGLSVAGLIVSFFMVHKAIITILGRYFSEPTAAGISWLVTCILLISVTLYIWIKVQQGGA